MPSFPARESPSGRRVAGAASPPRRPAQVSPVYSRGVAGLVQALQRLQTTASAMHTGAHPDDEDTALIARARPRRSRARGLSLAQSRRRRPEHHRHRAVRRARRHPHRGAAAGADARRRRSVLHPRLRLRLHQDDRGSGREVGRGAHPRRHGARDPPLSAARADPRALQRHARRRPRPAPARRQADAARVQGRRRSGRVPRADRGRPASVAGEEAVRAAGLPADPANEPTLRLPTGRLRSGARPHATPRSRWKAAASTSRRRWACVERARPKASNLRPPDRARPSAAGARRGDAASERLRRHRHARSPGCATLAGLPAGALAARADGAWTTRCAAALDESGRRCARRRTIVPGAGRAAWRRRAPRARRCSSAAGAGRGARPTPTSCSRIKEARLRGRPGARRGPRRRRAGRSRDRRARRDAARDRATCSCPTGAPIAAESGHGCRAPTRHGRPRRPRRRPTAAGPSNPFARFFRETPTRRDAFTRDGATDAPFTAAVLAGDAAHRATCSSGPASTP